MKELATYVCMFLAIYLLIGDLVLNDLLKRRFLRPLTDKEMFNVIIHWPKWL